MTELPEDLPQLERMLGDTRMRYHKRQTPFSSSEALIDLDLQIRALHGSEAPPEEVHRLIARLRALDPH